MSGATKTMTFKDFMKSKALNLELTRKEKDTIFATLVLLVLLVSMVVGSLITPTLSVVPAYLVL